MFTGRVRVRFPIIFSIISLFFCINLSVLSPTALRAVRLIIIALDSLIVFKHWRIHGGIKNPEIWAFSLMIIVSGYINYGIDNSFFQSVLYALMLLMAYLTFNCAVTRYGETEVCNAVCIFLILVMTVIDILIIISGGTGTYITGRTDYFYYIGSKFVVSYLNMFLLALLMWRYKTKNNILLFIVAGIMIITCYFVDCMTGVTGILTMLIMYLLKDKICSIASKPIVVVAAVIASGVFALVMQFVVSLSAVQWFLRTVVHTDLELTGRAGIFAILWRLFSEKPIWGYGYGNTAVKGFLGYGNPQNGLFDIAISYGIVGVIGFLFVVYQVVKSRDDCEKKDMFPILTFIYGMIICGTVEINFSILMLIGLALYKKGRRKV